MQDRVVSYAQNREDVILAAFFDEEEKGFYVDVGANHPTEDSVTKYFYDRGWTGINIEPNKYQYNLLLAERPKDTNLKIGISDKPGELKLRIYDKGDGLSTFSKEMKDDYEAHSTYFTDKYHEDTVEVTTLNTVFSANKVTRIHFLKVDVEGYEYEVLKGNDWNKYRPEVICIEANHIIRDWHPLLEKHRYEKVFFDGLNEYFVAKEASHRRETFSYVKGLIGRPIVSSKWDRVLVDMEVQLKRATTELELEKSKHWDAQRQVAFLIAELQNQRRITNLVKTLVRSIDRAIYQRIEALNKPKRKHASKLIAIDEALLSKENPTRPELVEAAKANDKANFYSTKSGTGAYSKSYAYKISLFIYNHIHNYAKFAAKLLRKVIRKLRREAG